MQDENVMSSATDGRLKIYVSIRISSQKHVRVMYTPYTPLLYSNTGVCRGIHIFLIFAPKHKLWVIGEAVLTSTHNLCFGAKIRTIGIPLQTPVLLYKSWV